MSRVLGIQGIKQPGNTSYVLEKADEVGQQVQATHLNTPEKWER